MRLLIVLAALALLIPSAPVRALDIYGTGDLTVETYQGCDGGERYALHILHASATTPRQIHLGFIPTSATTTGAVSVTGALATFAPVAAGDSATITAYGGLCAETAPHVRAIVAVIHLPLVIR